MPSSKLTHKQKLDIIEKFSQGWKIFAIHKDLKEQKIEVSYDTVRYVVEKYRTGSFHHAECVLEKEHKFRKITNQHIVLIQESLREDCVQSSGNLLNLLPNSISRRTVLRAVRHAGWTSAQPRYCALVSKKTKEKRTEFCEKLMADQENFNNAIFSDECTIQLHDNKTTCFRELNSAAPIIPRPKHPLKVHMWAAISRQGTCPLLIFDGIMDKEFFTNAILNNVLLPFLRQSYSGTHRSVQDNDPKHSSKYAQQFMEENDIHWWKWPAGNQGQIPASSVTKQIVGILGILRLVSGPYLIVITKKIKVGEIDGHTIWKMTDTELHSYQKTMLHLTDQQANDNKMYLSMVEAALKTKGYYFSTDFDLTHTLQRLSNTSPDFTSSPLHERVDQRFVWNSHLLKPLAQQPELDKYCLPVVHGFIECSLCTLNNHTFTYLLISRRCVYRAGTRFFVRGVDNEGQVANFVETEQIVLYKGHKASFVQTRGSIPLCWAQKPDLRYKPKMTLSPSANHIEGFRSHFNDQIYHYGKNIMLNLVNQCGDEGLLEKAFRQTVISSQQTEFLSYVPFDFHKECSRMRWHRLSLLMDEIEKDRRSMGFFLVYSDGSVHSQQDGVFRTNCIDCLDRTNVVQSLIARTTLHDKLVVLGILEKHEQIVNDQTLTNFLNNVWADNADACSVQYAGTGALKTDFTRVGKRTKMGLLADGFNSLVRYFKNNFSDGFRQDSMDLLLGNYIVEENEGITIPSPFQKERDWKFYAVPVIFLVAFAMLVISILIPDEHVSEQILYVMFWAGASAISLAALYIYGEEFVDKPRLAQSKFKTD